MVGAEGLQTACKTCKNSYQIYRNYNYGICVNDYEIKHLKM